MLVAYFIKIMLSQTIGAGKAIAERFQRGGGTVIVTAANT